MSVNKVILLGNVGKDPDVRYIDSGVAVANLTLATTERGYKAANGTQVPDRTEWHNIVLWRGLAEIAEKYIRKGSKIYVEGKIRTRSYDDQQGVKRYVTEVWGDSLEMLDRKPDGAQASNRTVENQAPRQTTQVNQSITTPQSKPLEEEVDDLPF
ncbi:single-strand DNA-binding protein [Dysgonomonadaceae bacterium PH5-43]|nr:single-strand DNA-binding protein [Dysgonomonadaceae bacterium PH5-43]